MSFALRVRFHGVRGSIPSPGYDTARHGGNTSCVELRCGDEILILDAGSGIRNLGNDLLEEFGSRAIVANLLISHTHWDHIQGLPFFAPLYAAQNRVRIFSADADATVLECALRNQMQSPHFPVALDEMRGLAGFSRLNPDCTQLGEFRIEATNLNHPGGCAGFNIEAHGVSIAYLPDHEPYRHSRNGAGNTLAEFVKDADLLILDTQYTEREYQERIGWGHGCLTDSVALAVDAGVRRLLLFHHDPSHHDHELDEMVREARRLAASADLVIEAAAENQTIIFDPGARSNERSIPAVRKFPVAPIFAVAARRKVAFRR